MDHAPRNAVTPHQTSRRRRLSISVLDGPGEARPAAAAAFEVPTAGVPTYFVASIGALAAGFAASGLGLTLSASGSAMSAPPEIFQIKTCYRIVTPIRTIEYEIYSPNARSVRGHQTRQTPGIGCPPRHGHICSHRINYDLAERPNKRRQIVQPAAHFKLPNTQPRRFFPRFVIDLTQSFHVIGNKRNGNDADLAHIFLCQIMQRAMQGRL